MVYELKAKMDAGNKKEKVQTKEGSKKVLQENHLSKEQMDSLKAELGRTGVAMGDVKERYKIQTPETMGEELYKKVMAALLKTRTAA